MIKRIKIENFKSIKSLTMDLGRFNIFIGENGSGKTNIMEAIALGGAAVTNKLDNEFLAPRGIRVASPEFMTSAFQSRTKNKEINLIFYGEDGKTSNYRLKYKKTDNSFYPKLVDEESENLKKMFKQLSNKMVEENKAPDDSAWLLFELIKRNLIKIEKEKRKPLLSEAIQTYVELSNFIIYSPENTILRIFKEEGQILPLGIKGEGLFNLIGYLLLAKDQGPINEIKENLKLFDWFEDFKIPKTLAPNEFVLHIKDRFIHSKIKQFDQRSTNEGFLFFLFYLCLFISKDTPSFFAIDNLETSFNPRLCTEITKVLIRLSKEKNKQVIVTTHNPSILDGLNLHDDEQRLFVIRRNIDGHTIADRISEKPKTDSPVKLSQVWTRGYIGGLPDNF